jgi:hypothetical protein
MKKVKYLILIILITVNCISYGQLAVGYSTDGNTLSLSINPSKKFWGELRVNTKAYKEAAWSYSDRGITQAYMMVTLFSTNNISFYSGGGAGVNLLSKGNDKWFSLNVPLGLKMNPFSKFPNLYLFGEYDPMIIPKDEVPVIHCISAGFKFLLSRKE